MRPWARAAAVTALVVAVDQATKALAVGAIERGDREAVFFFVDLVNVRNRGVAFGLLGESGGLVIALTAAALALVILLFALHTRRPGLWLPTGMLLGGAIGNLVDRARLGAVVDFIDLPLWPAFNLADVSITLGVLVLLYVLEGGRDERRA